MINFNGLRVERNRFIRKKLTYSQREDRYRFLNFYSYKLYEQYKYHNEDFIELIPIDLMKDFCISFDDIKFILRYDVDCKFKIEYKNKMCRVKILYK